VAPAYSFLFLPYRARNISRGVDNPNDLQRFFLRVVDNPIIAVGLHEPESQRQISEVFSKTASEGSIGQQSAGIIDRCFDAIRCFNIIAGDVGPDFEEVFDRLRCELVTTHAWRFLASQERFLSSKVERTRSESISSPRCAAA